jgi:hypothetical protein
MMLPERGEVARLSGTLARTIEDFTPLGEAVGFR